MKNLVAEIFAVGMWNGFKFDRSDLDKIVTAFKELMTVHKVPLKFGHNDKQPVTDGQPALGWVEDVWVDSDEDGKSKLFARFSDMPEVVFSAVKNKLYRKVSIELDIDVLHKETKYPYVLSGVALLGADIPAVSSLADLTAYMGRTAFSAESRQCFSAIDNQLSEVIKVEPNKELLEQIAKLQADNAALAQSKSTLEADNAKFAREQAESAERETKAKVEAHRGAIVSLLESAVKGMQITPAQSASFGRIARIADDEAVMAIAIDDVKDFISESHAGEFSRESGDQTPGFEGAPDEVLTQEAYKIQNGNPGMNFSVAMQRAMQANPKLGTAWARDQREDV